MPMIERRKVVGKICDQRDLFLGIVVHDFLNQSRVTATALTIETSLFPNEPLHIWSQGAAGNSLVIWGECRKELDIIAADRMIRIV